MDALKLFKFPALSSKLIEGAAALAAGATAVGLAALGGDGATSVVAMPPAPEGPVTRSGSAARPPDSFELPNGKTVVIKGLDGLEAGAKWVGGVVKGVRGYLDDSRAQARIEVNPNATLPAPKNTLRAVTFNIQEGGHDLAAVRAYLRREQPDVVLLQEASVESARTLAHEFGMHAAYGANWRIILSRYPIVDAKEIPFPISHRDRFARALETKTGEPLEVRGMLDATLRIGNHDVHAIDTHFSTHEKDWSALEFDALRAHVATLEAAHTPALVAGDFNANLALARPGVTDPANTYVTPTDTAVEWSQRYGRPGHGPGNLEDPAAAKAAHSFDSTVRDAWRSGDAGVLQGGQRIRASDALEQLRLGGVDVNSDAGLHLREAADGVSHLSVRQRIDGLFGTSELKPLSETIDQDVRASDHQPVSADFELDRR